MKYIFFSLFLIFTSSTYAEDENTPKELYTASPGHTLSNTLANWSKTNNYQLLWNVKSELGDTLDWDITHPVQIEGNYYEAVATLLRAYRNTDRKIKFNWTFYKNNVLEIHLEETL